MINFLLTILSFVLYLLSFIFFPVIVKADTDILDGRLKGDIYWSKENSPYILHDYVNITGEGSFTVGPGVTIISASTTDSWQDPYSIYSVNGINLLGSKDEPINILNMGYLNLGDINNIKNTIFKGTTLYMNRGTTTILSSKISDTNTAIDARGSFIDIKDSEISNNSTGILSNVFVHGPSMMYKNNNNYSENIGGIGNAIDLDIEQNIINIHDSIIENNKDNSIINNTSNTIDATDNWWGNSSGPSNIKGLVLADPWKKENPNKKDKCCSSILFIPGLEGSRLYREEKSLFGMSTNTLWEPNRNDDVRKLYLDSYGNSKDSSIYTSDIIGSAFGLKNIYKSFINNVNNLKKDNIINNWLPFAYDWRKNISDIVNLPNKYNNDTKYLLKEIDRLASTSNTGKVTIIAHSNGGLIAKMLGKELEKKDKLNLIDRVIFIAVPELGTPHAIAGILNGEGQSILGGAILSASVARSLGVNMPGAYGLLPSKEYFNRFIDATVTFAGKAFKTYSSFRDFLLGIFDKRKEPKEYDLEASSILKDNILSEIESVHDSIDNWHFPDYINVFSIAGWGKPTTKTINYDKDSNLVNIKKDLNGDGTVLTGSATGYTSPYIETNDLNLYFNQALLEHNEKKDISHENILENDSILSLISKMLFSTSTNSLDKEPLPEYISYEKPKSKDYPWLSWITVSVHSPVDINIYDSHGRHMGMIPLPGHPDSDIKWMDNTIGGTYDIVGEDKYFTIPADENYSVRINGTGYGKYTLIVEKFVGEDMISVASTTYKNLPVTPSLIASTTIDFHSLAQVLNIDSNGDGIIDKKIKYNHIEYDRDDNDKDDDKKEIHNIDLLSPYDNVSIKGQRQKADKVEKPNH